jgi:hypothetical protein
VVVGSGTTRAVSGADGSYEVRGLPAGIHLVKGEADGFLTFFGEVKVAEGPTVFEIRLRRPAGASPSPGPSAAAPSDAATAPASDAGSVPRSDAAAAPASDAGSVPRSDAVAAPASDAGSVPLSDAAAVAGA